MIVSTHSGVVPSACWVFGLGRIRGPAAFARVRYHQAIVRRESRARAVSEWLTRPHRRTAGAVGKGVLVTWVEQQLRLVGFCDECPSGVDVTLLLPDLGLTFML